jgi:CheY-like chemotaxis protein
MSLMALRILIVDDEAVVREILSRQLKAWDYEVRLAASAEDALALLEKEGADAVLLDNVLPGMTGLRALAEIRKRSRAPVILMTGHFDTEFEQDALLLGAAAVLAKPLNAEALRRALESL